MIAATLARKPSEPSMAFFHASMAIVAAVFALFAAASLVSADLSFHPAQLSTRLAIGVVPCLIVAAYSHWRGYVRVRDGVLAAIWAGVFNGLSYFPMYAAARSRLPLRDHLLARLDARLGLQVPAVLGWFERNAAARHLLAASYDLLMPMMICAAVVTAFFGPIRAIKRYIVSVAVAICLAIPVSWACPAVGPWVTYGFHPNAGQAACAQFLGRLRQPGPFTIDMDYTAGLIAFPSFHAILAALACIALWSVPKLRAPAAILCALIVCSTVATGWHYVADALGGIVFAALAHAGATLFLAVETKRAARSARQLAM
jgi:membrane-associated phospholipid phosphatase